MISQILCLTFDILILPKKIYNVPINIVLCSKTAFNLTGATNSEGVTAVFKYLQQVKEYVGFIETSDSRLVNTPAEVDEVYIIFLTLLTLTWSIYTRLRSLHVYNICKVRKQKCASTEYV